MRSAAATMPDARAAAPTEVREAAPEACAAAAKDCGVTLKSAEAWMLFANAMVSFCGVTECVSKINMGYIPNNILFQVDMITLTIRTQCKKNSTAKHVKKMLRRIIVENNQTSTKNQSGKYRQQKLEI